jgi:hypothetical protein
MATSVGIKVTKKKPRATPRVQRGGKLQEPDWTGAIDWDGKKFHSFRRNAADFYYEHFKQSDLANDVYAWMKNNGYTAKEIKSAKAAPNSKLSIVTAYNARMLNKGMPDVHPAWNAYWEELPGTIGTPKPVSEYLKERVTELIQAGSSLAEQKEQEESETKTVAFVKPNIQDRLKERASEVIGEIEGRFDDFVWANDFKGEPKLIELLTNNNIIVQQTKMIVNDIEKNIKYYEEVLEGKDPQLVEGYKHWGKRQTKAVIAWWQQAMSEVNGYTNIKKVNKAPRKRKPVSPEKQVSKLKYLKEFAELGLKSVDPTTILTASELWVYNTKTRKLGLYVTDTYQPVLMVKNSAIIGFDASNSTQKTLRKPKDQLKDFASNGKPAAKKWFKGIRTTEIKLNGRINADTILLKTYK